MRLQRKTPFVVALNKIDRCYDWKAIPNGHCRETIAQQKPQVLDEFNRRVRETIALFSEQVGARAHRAMAATARGLSMRALQGLNTALYYENPYFAKYVSLVPTSAITGEGVPDLLMLLVRLTQARPALNALAYLRVALRA